MSIGAVTKATGISTHTLRKWESRYGVIEPLRTPSGRRAYTPSQVDRLILLRDLVALGHQIGRLSTLSDEELEALAVATPARQSGPEFNLVTVVGPVISAVLSREQLGPVPFRLVTRPAAEWLAGGEQDTDVEAQALVVEMSTLSGESCARLLEFRQETYQRVIVVYGFAARATLRMLLDGGIICLKAPANGQEVLRALAQSDAPGVVAALADPTIPTPRFSADSIARLAGMAPSVRCECPHHIAQLLTDISAFEEYSMLCEQADPGDRELHARLRLIAANARALFEEAMENVARAEGLELEELES
ncbi:MAG: MerR family transcriptional regulator [Pseudomonadales bacterium]|nr:MerR family transcriptional regulator [Pseudomonadales bacterium]NIX07421.1 MerR family transcriptional regulator [Pseudomonadales bacterium]